MSGKRPKKNTEAFFRFLNETNERVKKNEEAVAAANLDPYRVKREAERRERLGTLRAVPHPRRKTGQVRNVFGHTNLSE